MHSENRPPAQRAKTINKAFTLHRALLDNRLAKSDCTLLAAFLEYRNNGEAWPGAETLAIVTGLNIRTVRLSMRCLEEYGYIEIIFQGGGRNKTNVWSVHLTSEAPFKERIKKAAERWLNDPRFRGSAASQNAGENCRKPGSKMSKNAGETTSRTLTYRTQLKNPSAPAADPMDRVDAMQHRKIREIEKKLEAGKIPPLKAHAELLILHSEADDESVIKHAEEAIGLCEDMVAG